MNNIQKRFLLFLLGCIPVRLSFMLIAKNYTNYLKIMSYFALMISIGFFYIFITGSRVIGGETFGDKIWWNNLRPVHGILYLLFAYNAIRRNKNAWIYLFIDVIFGLIAFLIHHYINNSFSQLM